MHKTGLSFLLLAGFLIACSSTGNSGPQSQDNGPGPDICTCSTDQQCQAKAPQCMKGVCRCTCQNIPEPKGVSCDDKNPKTDPDTCDGNGNCKGIPVRCGDGACTGDETCLSCPQDCACKSGYRCVDGKCEKLPKCNDNECEQGETCASCPADCPCAPGKVCFADTGECLDCQAYCKKAKKDCGVDKNGCNCGTCPAGKTCNALGQCEDSSLCGNAVCDATEDCSTCPQDCGCTKDQACMPGKDGAKAQCQDCKKVCADHNKECGQIFSCNCGGCPTCYHCYQGQCKGSKDCLCYHKQCGTVDGFNCGTCGAGEECYLYKCMKGCDQLCQGKECGWSGTGEDACFCGFCDGCTQCNPASNTCVAAATDNADEPNNKPASATKITGENGSLTSALYPSKDDDWFKMHISTNISILFKLTGLAPDKDYDLVECLKCEQGTTDAASNWGKDQGVYQVDPLVDGGVCYASINLAGEDEQLRLVPKCNPPGGTYYVGVLWGSDETDCGSSYTLSWSH